MSQLSTSISLICKEPPILDDLCHCPGKKECSKITFLNHPLTPWGVEGCWRLRLYSYLPIHCWWFIPYQWSFSLFKGYFLWREPTVRPPVLIVIRLSSYIVFSSVKVLSYTIFHYNLKANLHEDYPGVIVQETELHRDLPLFTELVVEQIPKPKCLHSESGAFSSPDFANFSIRMCPFF